MSKHWEKYKWLFLGLGLAAILKFVLTITQSVPFNGDEAVVASMARHILQGSRPVFFYGQAYMGSLDAWLIAAGFAVFGEHVWVIRLVHSLLYLIYLITIWWLARKWFRDPLIPIFAVFIAAIPPVVVSTYTTATLGGYGESLILGNLILGLGYDVVYGDKQDRWWAWFLLGAIGGLAFWTLGMAGVYLLPVGLIGLYHFKFRYIPKYLLAAAGFFLGALPWWWHNFTHNWAGILTLSGPSDLVESSALLRFLGFWLFGVSSLIGGRFPWKDSFVIWPVLLLALVLHLALAVFAYARWREKSWQIEKNARIMLLTFTMVFIFVFTFSSFGVDATGRYLLPLYLVLVLGLAGFATLAWQERKLFALLIIGGVWLVNGAGTAIAASAPDKLTTQFDPITSFDNSQDAELIEFLEEHGETRGYTNYWVAYRIAFLTDETLLFSPELPYKYDLRYTTRDKRYQPYVDAADESEKSAIITTKHPVLDRILRDYLNHEAIGFAEKQIGSYHIFYALTETFRPEAIGYGDAYTKETVELWKVYLDE